MKKFLVILLFLIILGGVGFFFGWAQLTVPPGSYGVMQSKTHGLESQVIRAGDFRWVWYKLIPTNVKISVYTIKPVKYPIKSSGSLSSGQAYAAMAGINADFSWEISGDLSFSLKPELLPELTARENISNNAGLDKFEEIFAARIGNFVIQRLNSYVNGEDGKKAASVTLTGSFPELNNEIERAFPEIENINCSLQVVRFPDYDLYQAVKALYQEYLNQQNSILNSDTLLEAQKRIQTRTRMDELNQYGELLTKYPILLQYMALEKGIAPANEKKDTSQER